MKTRHTYTFTLTPHARALLNAEAKRRGSNTSALLEAYARTLET